MRGAGVHTERMGILVQIRDVPEDVHRILKARAAESGQSLSEFLRVELAKVATRPTLDEIRRRIEARGRLTNLDSTADLIRSMRDEE